MKISLIKVVPSVHQSSHVQPKKKEKMQNKSKRKHKMKKQQQRKYKQKQRGLNDYGFSEIKGIKSLYILFRNIIREFLR